MRLGVFGGTFDPVHLGHLVAAQEAKERAGLDRVLFMPAGDPWLKGNRHVSEATHRLAMVRMAVGGNPSLEASDVEVARAGPTYTVDTLEELRRQGGGDTRLFVILGLDALSDMASWHRADLVLELSTVVGLARLGFQELDREAIDSVRPGSSDQVLLVRSSLIGISSTDIRNRVAEGRPIKYLVPEAVEAYIYEHRLYRSAGRQA